MVRIALILAAILFAAPIASAGCPGGRCPRPTNLLSTPTLARPARKEAKPVLAQRGYERSVVVWRGYSHRGPGLLARITFRPGRR